jgi:hypothetical protein
MKRLVIIFIIYLVTAPSSVLADAKQFIPRISNYYGELEVDIRYENDSVKVKDEKTKVSDTTLIERLNLYTLGYIYHPNFITFNLNLSGGLKEEEFKSTYREVPWRTDLIDEYEFRMWFLPAHPYNLEVFTIRRTPLTSATASEGTRPVSTSYGSVFKYEMGHLHSSLSFIQQTSEAGPATSESQTYYANVSYFIGPLSNTAGYQHIVSATSLKEKASRDYSFFDNRFDMKNIRLMSKIALTKEQQESPDAASLSLDTLSWTERLEVKLPWNFNSNLAYTFFRDTSETGRIALSPAKVSEGTTRDARLEIGHQLFASLRSQYAISYATSEYNQGESKVLANSLKLTYTKRIPKGMLRLGTDFRLSQLDRKGQAIIINELHSAQISGSFPLISERVEESSIDITVATVVPPGELSTFVPLDKDIHYTVTPGGNTFIITINSLDGTTVPVCQTVDCLDAGYEYTFRVFYSTITDDFIMDTTEYGMNMRFELFKSLIDPYFSYYKTMQNVVSGTLSGIAEDSENITIGLQLQKQPYMAIAEYQEIISTVNPSQSWRTELNYNKKLSLTTMLNGKVHYASTHYAQRLSGGAASGYTQTFYGAIAKVQKHYPESGLNATIGITYDHSEGLGTARTYSLNSTLSFKTGYTDILFQGRVSLSESEGVRVRKEALSELFYLTLRRRLF